MAVYKDNESTKDNKSWVFYCRYKDLNGKCKAYKSKKYKYKKEAESDERLFKINKNKILSNRIIFNDIVIEYLSKLKTESKESTLYGHNSVINSVILPFFNNTNINDIRLQNIEDWKTQMKNKGYSINYINKAYRILKNIFQIAVDYHDINKNIVEIAGTVKDVKEDVFKEIKIKYITYDQFNLFIENVNDIMWNTFFNFLYFTGCRKGEVQALTWNDIDFINKEISITKNLTVKCSEQYKITSTKNLINRKIRMSKKLYSILIDYYKYCKKIEGFKSDWFVFGCVRFLPQSTIDRKKHYYFGLCDVPEITIHEFRHSHVSLIVNEAIKNNIDIDSMLIMASERLGHSIDVMKKVYIHMFPTSQKKIVDLLDNL